MILRDGQVIDLKARVAPRVHRRETRLEAGIIDGTLTAVVQVPDLRVGDVLDQARLLESRPLVGGAERSGSSWLEWSRPVVLSRTQLTRPRDLPPEPGAMPDRITLPRRLPLCVGGLWVAAHEVRVRNGPIECIAPEPVTISNPAFDFSLATTVSDGGNLVLRWRSAPRIRAVPWDLTPEEMSGPGGGAPGPAQATGIGDQNSSPS